MTAPINPRSLCAWAPASLPPVNLAIAKRALLDIGICEMPPGSNRSGRIDEYVAAVNSPFGSYWCAAAVAAWSRESGAETPPTLGGSCDAWARWARDTGRWTANPEIGRAVVYGVPGDASHIGVVVRVSPLLLSVEGNTTLEGFGRNGVAVDLKLVNRPRVLGYIDPVPQGMRRTP
jgi:hypothetical protein